MHPVWLNGEPAAGVSPLDRGLAYGDGLFETIRITKSRPTLFELHMERLLEGATRLGLSLDSGALVSEIQRYLLINEITEGVLKIILSRGVGGRGYNPSGCESHHRILTCFEVPDYTDGPGVNGIELFDCQTRLGLSPATAGMKHLNRLEQVMARGEWDDARYAEGLMLNINNQPIEGTMSNLFLVSAGTLLTPDLSMSGVAGVCRQFVINHAAQWGIAVETGSLFLEQLFEADELFICNSVFGVWPVVAYAAHRWSIGPVTRTVQQRVEEALNR
ncbi:aminodeoxychorismate lyase [Aestuariirhabdus sp. LZHN29]|uniref:aminodeoxychorismate lyase n=1 Tax=Aestuariirhabdus sp. LZHN29 TaxID=3417462 RepID=UPI003CEF7D2F